MASFYRDYGTQTGMNTLEGYTEGAVKRSQVFLATHKINDTRSSYRERSFISFSFGGKLIEDFDLISTVNGDRMTRELSGSFDDLTTNYDVIQGQYYHGTYFRTNSLSLTLSTDGIDQHKLEEFKHWFAGGQTRELILSEHPNRAIMARVAQPPQMDMLPFEKEVAFMVGSYEYTTSTTVYKGSINLEFIMDEPFWYSIVNIFGSVDENNNYITTWEGVNFFDENEISKDKMKDILKIVYEDGIPIYNMIASPMLFGNDIYASSGGRIISCIASDAEIIAPGQVSPSAITEELYNGKMAEGVAGYYNNGLADDDTPDINFYLDTIDDGEGNMIDVYAQYYCGAVIEDHSSPTNTAGVIDGAFISSTKNVHMALPPLDQQGINTLSLYYAGTAPAPLKIKFTIPIQVDTSTGYFTSINSKYVPLGIAPNQHTYNRFIIEGTKQKEMRIITPNFFTSYNNVIEAFTNVSSQIGVAWEKIREMIRDEIRHPIIRKYAILLINQCTQSSQVVEQGQSAVLISEFQQLIKQTTNHNLLFTVELNTKTGEAIGTIQYRNLSLDNQNNFVPPDMSDDENDLQITTENIGDMISSNYLLLDEKNYFDEYMQISAWDASSEAGKKRSHRIYHDFPVTLEDFQIEYKNMYY